MKLRKRTEVTLDDIARELNPIHALSALSFGTLHQSDLGYLVEAKVQALPSPFRTRASLPGEDRA
jgi:hypothetical protein